MSGLHSDFAKALAKRGKEFNDHYPALPRISPAAELICHLAEIRQVQKAGIRARTVKVKRSVLP